MPYPQIRPLLAGALAALVPLAGCTAQAAPAPSHAAAPAPALRLAAFDTCAALRDDLRRAAADAVGPYGLPGGGPEVAMMTAAAPSAADATGRTATSGAFSSTNSHEANADEPDIVKTDGRRIVTVQNGVLRVVDAATRKQTGELKLAADALDAKLLLAGDAALVLAQDWSYGRAYDARLLPRSPQSRPEALLVDLAGTPKVVSRYRTDGVLVDTRQTGSIARVVLRSTPRITFPELPDVTDQSKRLAANRKTVAAAPADAWLPRYEVSTGGRTERGQVGCDRVRRPVAYSGTSLVTVLTFDLAAPKLGNGDPLSVVADGDTVYSTGTSLYLANDNRWQASGWPMPRRTVDQQTEIYQFDTTGTASPTLVASGAVPGWLVNQYALSEWAGHLRVATTLDGTAAAPGPLPADGATADTPPADTSTVDPPTADGPEVKGPAVKGPAVDTGPKGVVPPGRGAPVVRSRSAIRVLRATGGALVQTGVVDGLGKGEQIYAVRFVGSRGYVVTFRQTDPLYTVDLADPAKPTVTGELKVTGYSAHLQPVGESRLIGIGQEASAQGRTRGSQISLFDVADPAAPRMLARHEVANGTSDAEFDPHALLWWPATSLLVVPMTVYPPVGRAEPSASALALRVTANGLTPVGAVSQPRTAGMAPIIQRSLVVGDVLWTLSQQGLQASDLASLKRIGWLPMP